MNKRSLVLLSGGQDSTTSLYWAKNEFDSVDLAINIQYGQRHSVETSAAYEIAKLAQVPYQLVNVGNFFKEVGDSALVGSGDVSETHRSSSQLPASFVPGRNIILLTVAAAFAYKMDIENIVIGACQTDFSGYPDCRRKTIDSIEETLFLGMDRNFIIHTPLMNLTKAQSVELARTLNGCWEALAISHTCYEGKCPPCGNCPACKIRAKGFAEAGLADPMIERCSKIARAEYFADGEE